MNWKNTLLFILGAGLVWFLFQRAKSPTAAQAENAELANLDAINRVSLGVISAALPDNAARGQLPLTTACLDPVFSGSFGVDYGSQETGVVVNSNLLYSW